MTVLFAASFGLQVSNACVYVLLLFVQCSLSKQALSVLNSHAATDYCLISVLSHGVDMLSDGPLLFIQHLSVKSAVTTSLIGQPVLYTADAAAVSEEELLSPLSSNSTSPSSSPSPVRQKRQKSVEGTPIKAAQSSPSLLKASPSPISTSSSSSRNLFPSSSLSDCVPLSALDINRFNCAIAVRVCAMSAKRTTKNNGCVQSFDLMDRAGDEIRATSFNGAVDKVAAQLSLHSSYIVSNFKLRKRNDAFNKLMHSLEIVFDSEVKLVPLDEASAIHLSNASSFFTPILDVITCLHALFCTNV